MTDPLLTIEDATREFRVSPKTVRRRLAAGEIEGAYKRPGSRGPEWVMPRSSLAAVGFVLRGEGPAVELPSDAGALADYWERRALDAEAALQAAGAGEPPVSPAPGPAPVRPSRRRVVPAIVLLLVGAAIGAVLALASTGGDEPEPAAADALDSARAVLASLTDGGDEIGIVGRVPPRALPPERTAVAADGSAPDGPRYVVAAVAGRDAPAVAHLRDTAEVVLDLAREDGALLVYDTAAVAVGPKETSPSTSSSAPAPPSEPSPTDDPASDADGPDPAASPAPPAPAGVASSEPGETVVVGPGDSFWSIATDLAASATAGEPSDVDVVRVWADLVERNRDRLVQPGNADLLHVGQTLVTVDVGR